MATSKKPIAKKPGAKSASAKKTSPKKSGSKKPGAGKRAEPQASDGNLTTPCVCEPIDELSVQVKIIETSKNPMRRVVQVSDEDLARIMQALGNHD